MPTLTQIEGSLSRWLTCLALVPAVGVVAIGLYAGSVHGAGTAGTAILVAAGAWVSGALLGFIFAVPQSSGSGATATTIAAGTPIVYHSNANLEQISDWLTKILVGLGLVELGKIVTETNKLVGFLAPALGNEPSSKPFALAVLIVYSVSGFMAIYLVTRIFLGRLFAQTEQSLNSVVQQAVQESQHAQDIKDAQGLGLVTRQLQPEPGTDPPTQDQLNKAVSDASQFVRIQMFERASAQRHDTWHDEATKPEMERTIPVFRALIAADTESRFHRNHGQLGYALKDQLQPDYTEAEKELSAAIAIRDRVKQKGFLLYEFNRALCRIKLNASPDLIVADLRMAAKSAYLQPAIKGDAEIVNWAAANNIQLADVVGAEAPAT